MVAMLVASMLTALTLASQTPAPQTPGSQTPGIQTPGITVTLRPESGSTSVVGVSAGFVARVVNGSNKPLVAVLETWTPPDVALPGLPGAVRLAAGKTGRFPCRVQIEPGRPAGTVMVRLILRRKDSEKRLAQTRVSVHVAPGRDFLRLPFDDRRLGLQPSGAQPVATGAWRASRQDRGAARGRSFLRLRVGGDGVGRHALLAPSSLGFDSDRFGHLVFWLRSKGEGRAALYLRVGRRDVVVPLRRPKLELDGGWHRVVIELDRRLDSILGDGNHRVTGIAVGNHLRSASADWTCDLDEFAVVRDAKVTAGDRLRALTGVHRRSLRPREIEEMGRQLHKIEKAALSDQELVDFELLHHDLAWQRIQRDLPRKRRRRAAGKARFEAMLRHTHHLDLDADTLRERGIRQARLHQRLLSELAEKIAPGKTWLQVAEKLKNQHPTKKELPEFAEHAMQEAIEFTIRKDLVTVPMAARHARIQVITGGSRSRTFPFGGYGGARPSAQGFTGHYFVSPPADWMTAEQARDRLRGNHRAKTRVVALHEVVPGHHLQTVVHRMRPLSPFRRRFYSTVFGEGWALYCEELMFREGFFPDQETRFAQLQMRLWRAVRIVVDVGLHTGRLSMADAEKMLVSEVGIDPINAKAEVLRYIDNPTRPMSYLVGYLIIEQLETKERRRLGPSFDGKAFRDRLLAYGPVPLPAVVKAMQRGRFK